MTDPIEDNERFSSHEDEISGNIEDENKSENPDDDSFKTSPREHRMGWERPSDEQMYESFDDIREQEGTHPADEEAD